MAYSDFLKSDHSMKFDVIVGNPPYQDAEAKSSKKTWPAFVDKSIELIKKEGWLALVTPATWLGGNSELFNTVKKSQCLFLCPDGTKYFPGVGTTISYYVIQNIPVHSPTVVNDGSEFFTLNFREHDILPRGCSKNAISIFQKMSTIHPLSIQSDSFCHTQRTDRVSAIQTTKFCYPNKHGAESVVWSNKEHPCKHLTKVMFYMSGTPKPYYDSGNFGISQHHGYIEVSSMLQGKNVIKFMTSKLVRFIIQQGSYAQAWNKTALKLIPNINFNINWDNDIIYQHFGLTQEEIDYIEATVK